MILPTKIVVHQSEKPSKCSVEPLRVRDDFEFYKFPLKEKPETSGYVRLAVGAPLLTGKDKNKGLLILDATWRHAETMDQEFSNVPARGLPIIKTAYPRISKIIEDPVSGLATIEAVYLAFKILGKDTKGLLDHYYWKDKFLEINREFFKSKQIPAGG